MAEDVNKITGQNGFIEHKIDAEKVAQSKFNLSDLHHGGISKVEFVSVDSFEDYSHSFGKINREKNKNLENEQTFSNPATASAVVLSTIFQRMR